MPCTQRKDPWTLSLASALLRTLPAMILESGISLGKEQMVREKEKDPERMGRLGGERDKRGQRN